jgi:Ser/Thr protein kinase RdoA (MazF antagonist)
VTQIPAPVAWFAAQAAGPGATVTDRSWARENSSVWEVVTPAGTRFFVKRHPTSRFHRREVHAYRSWPPPGAGAESADRAVGRVEEHLARAVGQLDAEQVSLVREHAARLPLLTRDLPAVPTHGDAQPRNFLWEPAAGRLSLIDFERAEPAPAVRDLVRLAYGPWDGNPGLREAFLEGYGRPLSSGEWAALRSFAALDALSGIQWGTVHGDAETVERGYRTLTALGSRR